MVERKTGPLLAAEARDVSEDGVVPEVKVKNPSTDAVNVDMQVVHTELLWLVLVLVPIDDMYVVKSKVIDPDSERRLGVILFFILPVIEHLKDFFDVQFLFPFILHNPSEHVF